MRGSSDTKYRCVGPSMTEHGKRAVAGFVEQIIKLMCYHYHGLLEMFSTVLWGTLTTFPNFE